MCWDNRWVRCTGDMVGVVQKYIVQGIVYSIYFVPSGKRISFRQIAVWRRGAWPRPSSSWSATHLFSSSSPKPTKSMQWLRRLTPGGGCRGKHSNRGDRGGPAGQAALHQQSSALWMCIFALGAGPANLIFALWLQ